MGGRLCCVPNLPEALQGLDFDLGPTRSTDDTNTAPAFRRAGGEALAKPQRAAERKGRRKAAWKRRRKAAWTERDSGGPGAWASSLSCGACARSRPGHEA